MTNDTRADQANDAKTTADEIDDAALEQAEGGFSMSGMFTQTTMVQNFSNVNLSIDNATVANELGATSTFLRTRPGRMKPW